MKVYTYDDTEYRSFTYDEEKELAEFVMTLLSQLWMRGSFSEFLETIYNKKLEIGFNITEAEWEELVYYLDLYIDAINNSGITWPTFYDDNKDIRSSLVKYDIADINIEIMKTTQLAWKEVWINHSRIHSVADKFRYLPKNKIEDTNDTVAYRKDQEYLNRIRAEAIDEAMKHNPELTYTEACIYVNDYIPRTPDDLL